MRFAVTIRLNLNDCSGRLFLGDRAGSHLESESESRRIVEAGGRVSSHSESESSRIAGAGGRLVSHLSMSSRIVKRFATLKNT